MCGICGFVGTHQVPDAAATGDAMAAVLSHRGPDGQRGIEVQSLRGPKLYGWLGHRRLRVIDLSPDADQPMCSDDGSVVLVYNGEAYNFGELWRELRATGARFRSTGDTEVVLRAYETWGERFVERVDGMFALAVWDAREGRLLLARDRTGKKPLYYSIGEGRITFGSEIKALLQAPWLDPRFDAERLPEFLTYGYVPNPATLYQGIAQVPPASTLTFDASGVNVREYWDPLPEAQDVSARVARPEIARLLDSATTRRLVSDVPLGAFLSGGVDSSLVVGLMSRASEEPVRTFSIGFPEEPSFDERNYARLVAKHFGTRHTEFAVEADALKLMDLLLWHHDQPYGDSSAIPTFMVSQLAREHVTVALNGDGGDEVFGGYDRFAAARIAEAVPSWVTRVAKPLVSALPRRHGYYSLRRRADRFLELSSRPPLARYQSWIAIFNEDLLSEVLTGDAIGSVTSSMDRWYARAARLPPLDQILYANFKTYLPDDLAVKMDRMSMANSLETRSPFLDTALIEYLARVPARDKVGVRRVKPLLRAALRDLLPDEIWNRRKHGFGVPMGKWLRGPLREPFEDEVLGHGARVGEYLDGAVLSRLWQEHQTGQIEHGFRFWTLMTLERWLRRLEAEEAIAPPPAISAS